MNEPAYEDSALYQGQRAYFFTLLPHAEGYGMYPLVLFPNGQTQAYSAHKDEQGAKEQVMALYGNQGRSVHQVHPEMFLRLKAERIARRARDEIASEQKLEGEGNGKEATRL